MLGEINGGKLKVPNSNKERRKEDRRKEIPRILTLSEGEEQGIKMLESFLNQIGHDFSKGNKNLVMKD